MRMKKIAAIALGASMAVSLTACQTKTAAPETTKAPEATVGTTVKETAASGTGMSYTPGTYTGEGTGMKGAVKVDVTFSDSAITDIVVKEHSETYGIGYGLSTTPVEVLPGEIVAAQSLGVDLISGATITCSAIKGAVKDAVSQAGGDVDVLKEVPVVKPEAEDETLEADVVIAGAGVAGLAAGIEAANHGAKVVIVEKQGIPGGATTRSGGKLLAAGTKWQEEQNIEDNADMMFDYLKGIGGDEIDDEKLKLFSDTAYDNMLWLEEMGMKVQDVEPIHSSLKPWRVHNTEGGGGMTDGHGGQIIVPMVETFEKAGGTIVYNTTADKLLEAEDGSIVGLSGTREDGTTVTVNAKGTIIATGGYAQNKEMMARYPFAEGYSTQVPKGNVGDGLVMAKAVGADVYDAPGVQVVFCSFTSGVGINEEAGLIVNSDGKRVVNEDTYQYHVAVALQKNNGNRGYYIADANDPNPTVQYALTLEDTPKADSIEELAELIGVDKTALSETVTRYNELCAAGEDKDFGKPADKMIAEGPQYAAIELKPAATVTYGGLVTDTTSHVLDPEGKTIPGLFAAGEVAFTGLFGDEYPCCGMAIGGGVYFGREAGREAAEMK
ncbi:MAG: FAD-dependent oxidoreductase [Hungatella hathewayi]